MVSKLKTFLSGSPSYSISLVIQCDASTALISPLNITSPIPPRPLCFICLFSYFPTTSALNQCQSLLKMKERENSQHSDNKTEGDENVWIENQISW